MTDQTPQTEAWEALKVDIIDRCPSDYPEAVMAVTRHRPAIEAQARAEGLDVDVLAEALWNLRIKHPKAFVTSEARAEALAREYRAIFAARRDEG